MLANMLPSILFILSLSSTVLAGPHSNRMSHRRHHARQALVARGDECENAAWQCSGDQLQRCDNGTWKTLRTCSGELVCSVDPAATGCIWSFQAGAAATSAKPTTIVIEPSSGADVSAGAEITEPATVIVLQPTSVATSSAAATPVIGGSLIANGTEESCEGEDAYEYVWTDDDEAVEDDDEDEDEPYCDEVEGQGYTTSYPSSTASATASAAPSLIGGALFGGAVDDSSSISQSSYTASETASATPSVVGGALFGGEVGNPSSISSQAYAAASTSSYKSQYSSGSAPVPSATAALKSWPAPHHVIYADRWLPVLPPASSLGDYNRFILAFWMTSGPADNAIAWQQMSASDRQATLADYHANDIALMVSAFGATDAPTSNGADPVQTAQDLAQYVRDYGLDGVDVDYEDMNAMNTNQAEVWIIAFQKELRRQLPSPYIITHAPVAPWFTSASVYPSGAYVGIHKAVGDLIDFYSIQFYNQGDGVYGDCETLLNTSGGWWPSTSVFEINSYAGVPLEKIIIGKPLDGGMASNGYMDPDSLSQCVSQAQAQGWNAGVMFWEWTSEATGIVATVLSTI